MNNQQTLKTLPLLPLLDPIVDLTIQSNKRLSTQDINSLLESMELSVSGESIEIITLWANDIYTLFISPSMWQVFSHRFTQNGIPKEQSISIISELTNIDSEIIEKEFIKDTQSQQPQNTRKGKKTDNPFEFKNGIIFKYLGNSKTIIIPESINGKPVIKIGISAFANKGLTKITLPNHLQSIGDSAFKENLLTELIIPDSVTYIGKNAFSNNNISSLKLSKKLVAIKTGVFAHNKLAHVIIPDGIQAIGFGAFSHNKLQSIQLPKTLNSIGMAAFLENKLESVTIPQYVTRISTRAFGQNDIANLQLPDTLKSIGNSAFQNNKLKSLRIPDGVTNIGSKAFENNLLSDVSIPDSVKEIGDNAFSKNNLKKPIHPRKPQTSKQHSSKLNKETKYYYSKATQVRRQKNIQSISRKKKNKAIISTALSIIWGITMFAVILWMMLPIPEDTLSEMSKILLIPIFFGLSIYSSIVSKKIFSALIGD